MSSMSVGGYWPSHLEARIRDMQQARVMNCEMEAGILLTLAGLFGVRAGAICVVSDRTPWPGPSAIDLDRNMGDCIEVATAGDAGAGPQGSARRLIVIEPLEAPDPGPEHGRRLATRDSDHRS